METDIVDIRESLENANWYPGENEQIITIVIEEAGAYFGGMKSIEEVVRVIENRIQLYLDEKN